jgi:glutamate--cysteine ligase
MPNGRILASAQELSSYFEGGARPPEEWGVGIEYERLGVLTDSGRAVPYHGPRSLSALLARLVAKEGWRPQYAGENIISLEKEGARITLEPGGQMELSGAVHRRLEDLREELAGWGEITRKHSDPLGITWLGLGLQPFTPLEEIPWTPKPRYAVMSAYLSATGTLSHAMMKQTACVQANLDYSDEADAMEKLRSAMGLTSVVTALYANSPLREGSLNGFLSYRSWIWQHTDPARCGLLPFVFESGAGFGDYLSYALDVPMMFILRGGRFVPMSGIPFRRYLQEGSGPHRATLEDFELHLTTLFPEVRLKRYLEVRGGDSGDAAAALSQVALWKGILYDAAARREAWSLVSDFSMEERLAFHTEAARIGPAARLGRRSALEIGAALHGIATSGLKRLGEPEDLLDPLAEILFQWKACPGQILQDRWLGEWRRDPRPLIEYCGRRTLKPTRPAGEYGGDEAH